MRWLNGQHVINLIRRRSAVPGDAMTEVALDSWFGPAVFASEVVSL
jgi:hypothetical protein